MLYQTKKDVSVCRLRSIGPFPTTLPYDHPTPAETAGRFVPLGALNTHDGLKRLLERTLPERTLLERREARHSDGPLQKGEKIKKDGRMKEIVLPVPVYDILTKSLPDKPIETYVDCTLTHAER